MELPAAMGTCTFPLSQGNRLGDAFSTTSSPRITRFGEAPCACPHVIRISKTDGLNGTRSRRDTSRLSTSVSMMSRQFQKGCVSDPVPLAGFLTSHLWLLISYPVTHARGDAWSGSSICQFSLVSVVG